MCIVMPYMQGLAFSILKSICKSPDHWWTVKSDSQSSLPSPRNELRETTEGIRLHITVRQDLGEDMNTIQYIKFLVKLTCRQEQIRLCGIGGMQTRELGNNEPQRH